MALKQQHYIYRLDIFKTDMDYRSAMLFDLYGRSVYNYRYHN